MTIYGHIWPYMANICPYMATYGHICPYMTIYDHIWPCSAPDDQVGVLDVSKCQSACFGLGPEACDCKVSCGDSPHRQVNLSCAFIAGSEGRPFLKLG